MDTKAVLALVTIPNIIGITISVLLAIFNVPSPMDFLIPIGRQTVLAINSTLPSNAPTMAYSITANNLFALKLLGFALTIETPLNIIVGLIVYFTRDE
jgi:hypothetical protein